jgi:hypothetical protein
MASFKPCLCKQKSFLLKCCLPVCWYPLNGMCSKVMNQIYWCCKATLNCRIRVRIMDWSGTPLFYVINLGKPESDGKSCLKSSLDQNLSFSHNAHHMKNLFNVASARQLPLALVDSEVFDSQSHIK